MSVALHSGPHWLAVVLTFFLGGFGLWTLRESFASEDRAEDLKTAARKAIEQQQAITCDLHPGLHRAFLVCGRVVEGIADVASVYDDGQVICEMDHSVPPRTDGKFGPACTMLDTSIVMCEQCARACAQNGRAETSGDKVAGILGRS